MTRFALAVAALVLVCGVVTADHTDTVFERLQLGKLTALREEVKDLAETLTPVETGDQYKDLRAVIHSHSYLSHDSRGTLEEMVAAAHASGTDVVMLTDHRSQEQDVLTEGFSGMHDGVLFFPGSEARGLLIYTPTSIDIDAPTTLQDLIDLVESKGGTTFLSHIEGHQDFDLTGVTGMEIYNLHAAAYEAPGIFQVITPRSAQDVARLMILVQAFQTYPREALAAIAFRPDLYLRRFDEMTRKYPLTGIAAPDSHSNTGIVLKAAEDGKVRVEELLGDEIAVLDAAAVPFPGVVRPDAQPGDVLFKLQLDPYDASMGHVGTFVLAKDLTPQEFLAGLRAGRCYVAFDWIANPEGFRFTAVKDDRPVAIMGQETACAPGLALEAALPAEAVVRLYRNGEQCGEITGRRATWPISQPGVYRVEAYVQLVGELRPWILSNPIYVR